MKPQDNEHRMMVPNPASDLQTKRFNLNLLYQGLNLALVLAKLERRSGRAVLQHSRCRLELETFLLTSRSAV